MNYVIFVDIGVDYCCIEVYNVFSFDFIIKLYICNSCFNLNVVMLISELSFYN